MIGDKILHDIIIVSSNIMKKIFILFILILTILLGSFYSEGMDTYVMKNALVNNDTGAGRITTIDTDGNFSVSGSDVSLSNVFNRVNQDKQQEIPSTTTPIPILISQESNTEQSTQAPPASFDKGLIQGLVK
jgi:hypothetical protein